MPIIRYPWLNSKPCTHTSAIFSADSHRKTPGRRVIERDYTRMDQYSWDWGWGEPRELPPRYGHRAWGWWKEGWAEIFDTVQETGRILVLPNLNRILDDYNKDGHREKWGPSNYKKVLEMMEQWPDLCLWPIAPWWLDEWQQESYLQKWRAKYRIARSESNPDHRNSWYRRLKVLQSC